MIRKASLPSLARIQRHWWEVVDGKHRFQVELFPNHWFHGERVALWGEGGRAPVCFACCMSTGEGGTTSMWLHRGHIVAETYGGHSEVDNLVPLCARCNGAMPRLTSRADSLAWMEDREYWDDYLDRIDASTPPGTPRHRVVMDAALGRDWTPGAFARHYARPTKAAS